LHVRPPWRLTAQKQEYNKLIMSESDIIHTPEFLMGNFYKSLLGVGITPDYLAQKIKNGCEAKKITRIKLKGYVAKKQSIFSKEKKNYLPENCEVITSSEEESLLEFYDDDGERQDKNRMDAEKLLNIYPSQKIDLGGSVNVAPALTDADREMITELADSVCDAIIREHKQKIKQNN